MANREPIQIVEIDIDYCGQTYGTSPCLATLSSSRPYKCFNTYATCQFKTAYTKTVKTVRFVNARANLPKGYLAYPSLKENGVTAFSSTVNLAGSNDKMNAFGKRATVKVDLVDFVSDDIGLDKYQTQRVSGAAQFNGVGYNPIEKGTFFSKLKARFPYYSGRPLRVIDGYVDDGVLSDLKVRNFVVTDMIGPDSDGSFTIEGKDVLTLADDDKALVPKASRGKLGSDITVGAGVTFSLIPAGIEVEYPTSGWATIGSEIVSFTRSGTTVTVVARGQYRTTIATHKANDTFQLAYNVQNQRVDDLVYDLLVNYANVPAAYCPKVTKWQPEITRWLSGLFLNTIIAKPTGVAQLIGELAVLGVSIWWDEVTQEIGMLANHPSQDSAVYPLSDRNNIKSIEQEDRDEDRITQIHFYTNQTDPTKNYRSNDNYNTINVIVDTDAENNNAYGTSIIKEVFCRWFNTGADSFVRTLALRLLKRFNTPPKLYTILLDAKDRDIGLTDVIELDSRVVTDPTGNQIKTLIQVIKTTQKRSGHEFEIQAQAFQYNGKYGVIMANTAPVYSLATDEQKRSGAWFVSASTLTFSDGSEPFAFT